MRQDRIDGLKARIDNISFMEDDDRLYDLAEGIEGLLEEREAMITVLTQLSITETIDVHIRSALQDFIRTITTEGEQE